MGVILGGPKARETWPRGEFVCSLQYYEGEEALFIWPRRKTDGAGAWVIPLSRAYEYADSRSGDALPQLIEAAGHALGVMKMQPMRSTIKTLVGIVLDELPRLIEMRPEPGDHNPGPQADVDIRDNQIKVVLH